MSVYLYIISFYFQHNAVKEQQSLAEEELPVNKMMNDPVKREPEPAMSPPPPHEELREPPEQQSAYIKSEPLNLNQEIPQSVPCNLSQTMVSAPPSTSTSQSFVAQQLPQPPITSIPPPGIPPPTSLQYPSKFYLFIFLLY